MSLIPVTTLLCTLFSFNFFFFILFNPCLMYLLLPQCTHNESCPYFETLKNRKNFIYESPNGLNHCIKWSLPL